MFQLRSTALAAMCALAVAGFSGLSAPAGAEPVNAPSAKVYAYSTGLSSQMPMTPAQAAQEGPQERNVWEGSSAAGGTLGCDLRCRTGFFGYR
jgi:hypothetical protein